MLLFIRFSLEASLTMFFVIVLMNSESEFGTREVGLGRLLAKWKLSLSSSASATMLVPPPWGSIPPSENITFSTSSCTAVLYRGRLI